MHMELFVPLVILAFVCEMVDSTLGMGYGTMLTPVLLLLGFEPIEVVPAVLLSEFVTGFLASIFHHELGNVNLRPGTRDFKITMVLSALSVAGVLIAVKISVGMPAWAIKAYIGLLVLTIGVAILLMTRRQKEVGFSWKRVTGLGFLAAFNKGISGGGYGPVVTGGQMLVGIDGRSAVGIASLAEGVTSLVGVLAYLASGSVIPWRLAPSLMLGAVLSTPLAALLVSRISPRRLTLAIGGFSTLLGSYTLLKLFL